MTQVQNEFVDCDWEVYWSFSVFKETLFTKHMNNGKIWCCNELCIKIFFERLRTNQVIRYSYFPHTLWIEKERIARFFFANMNYASRQ